MHQNIVRFDEFDVSWLQGSQCILAAARNNLRGFRSVSSFFSSLREARESTRAAGWILDLRACQKVPEELWNWVVSSWYPQIADEGLRRQALVLPLDAAASGQWQALQLEQVEQRVFSSTPRAIQWLGQEADSAHPIDTSSSVVALRRAKPSPAVAAVA